MNNLSLDRIGFRNLTLIEHPVSADIFSVAAMDYGQVAQQSQARATDYYGAGLEGSCALTRLVDKVVSNFTPLAPITDHITANTSGDWLSTLEMPFEGAPGIDAVMPLCCGVKPQSVSSSASTLKYNRTALATAVTVCDFDKWQASSSGFNIDLEARAIKSRMTALTQVSNMIAIQGGYGLKGIRGNSEYPAVYMANRFASMDGEQLYNAVLAIINRTGQSYDPAEGYTLALPKHAVRALNKRFSPGHNTSVLSVLTGACSCDPGVETGLLKRVVAMPHLACATPGVGSGDMGLLFVPEFLEWDLPVPYQTIEPERCGLTSIGAIVANVGEVIQLTQGHAIKIFNV